MNKKTLYTYFFYFLTLASVKQYASQFIDEVPSRSYDDIDLNLPKQPSQSTQKINPQPKIPSITQRPLIKSTPRTVTHPVATQAGIGNLQAITESQSTISPATMDTRVAQEKVLEKNAEDAHRAMQKDTLVHAIPTGSAPVEIKLIRSIEENKQITSAIQEAQKNINVKVKELITQKDSLNKKVLELNTERESLIKINEKQNQKQAEIQNLIQIKQAKINSSIESEITLLEGKIANLSQEATKQDPKYKANFEAEMEKLTKEKEQASQKILQFEQEVYTLEALKKTISGELKQVESFERQAQIDLAATNKEIEHLQTQEKALNENLKGLILQKDNLAEKINKTKNIIENKPAINEIKEQEQEIEVQKKKVLDDIKNIQSQSTQNKEYINNINTLLNEVLGFTASQATQQNIEIL